MANLTGFKSDNKGLFITKDSDANVKYGLDWTDWLPTGDSLSSCTVTIETISGDASPLALPTDAATDVTITGAVTNIRLNGGTDGNIYNIKAKIVTSQGNTDARHFRIVVEDKQA
tara:strand:+ start:247 stop:591 length:345 start_codon:yes stop_codon:yes gene_type:complete